MTLPIVERLSDEADLCRNEGASDIAALLDESRQVICRAIEALREISLGMGEFNRDPLRHAENTIDSMKEIAVEAFTKIGDAQ
jgi:hypothetical protein